MYSEAETRYSFTINNVLHPFFYLGHAICSTLTCCVVVETLKRSGFWLVLHKVNMKVRSTSFEGTCTIHSSRSKATCYYKTLAVVYTLPSHRKRFCKHEYKFAGLKTV